MKKIKVETVCMLGVLTSIIMFIVTCHFQIKDGYARDAGIYVPNIITNSLWGLLLLCIIFSVLFFNLPRFSKRNIAKVLAIALLVLMITAGLAIYISWQFSFEQLKKGLWNKSLKEIGPFVHAKGPIFVVKLTCNENFTQ